MCYIGAVELNQLIATGLTKTQALAYALLIEKGSVSPPQAATELKLTRTNAYKLFDKLAELGLAEKSKETKGIYEISNPTALINMAADLRSKATSREHAINAVMKDIVTKYYSHNEQPDIEVVSGKDKVGNAFRSQISLMEDIYFIRSRADITSMGFDNLHEIRVKPSRHGLKRFGILPDGTKGSPNYDGYKRANLEATWVKSEDYNAPVEWSVTKSSLLIILYGTEPHALTISNPLIAGSFLQLWHLMDSLLKSMPYYSSLPRKK